MRSINKVILIGNLTRDPEVRQTANGQAVTTFGLATNREWMTRDGQRHTSSEFHEVVAWSHLAEICSKFLKKGKLVYVEGYLKTRSWDTPEGTKKFKTEIVVQDMIMLEKRPKDGESEGDYIPDEEGMGMASEPSSTMQNHDKPARKITKNDAPKAAPVPKEEPVGQVTQENIDIDQDLGL